MTNPKPQTKRAQLIALISRKSGASMRTIEAKLNWQPHTIRAELSRLRKTGLAVTCEAGAKGPVYRAHHQEQA